MTNWSPHENILSIPTWSQNPPLFPFASCSPTCWHCGPKIQKNWWNPCKKTYSTTTFACYIWLTEGMQIWARDFYTCRLAFNASISELLKRLYEKPHKQGKVINCSITTHYKETNWTMKLQKSKSKGHNWILNFKKLDALFAPIVGMILSINQFKISCWWHVIVHTSRKLYYIYQYKTWWLCCKLDLRCHIRSKSCDEDNYPYCN